MLPQVKGAPVVAVSGLMGEGIDRLMRAIEEAYAVWNKRVPTATLNRWFEQAVDTYANPPPAVSAAIQAELHHAGQGAAAELCPVLLARRRGSRHLSPYLVNSLREGFDLPGTPIRLTLREKANPFAQRKRPS